MHAPDTLLGLDHDNLIYVKSSSSFFVLNSYYTNSWLSKLQ